MNERSRLTALLAVCAVLLLIGLVFSIRLTTGINQAAQQEATQHAPVPTSPAPAKAAPAPAHG